MNTQAKLLLGSEGMEELVPILEGAGLYEIEDIAENEITADDLAKLGITKFFHQKKLLRISQERLEMRKGGGSGIGGGDRHSSRRSSAASSSSTKTSPKLSPRQPPQQEGGDHVCCHVMAVRSIGAKQLSEREHYVKVSLCDLVGTSIVVPIGNTVLKTETARGPFPTFISDAAMPTTPPMEIPTNFRTHCIAFEVKEKRLLADNKFIGLAVFPISYFHKFSANTVVDSWFTLRSETNSTESKQTGQIRIRFTVPGGCPKAVGRAFHVTGVNMKERKLRVTVFEASINETSPGPQPQDYFHAAPSTYVSLTLDKAEEHQRSESQVVENSFTPCFDETFEYFGEVAHSKLLTVKLKERATVMSHPTIGTVRIPLQFFLSQTNATDIDQVFDAYDHDDTTVVRGQVHLRIEIRQRKAEEKNVSFVRCESIKEQRFLETPTESQVQDEQEREAQQQETTAEYVEPEGPTSASESTQLLKKKSAEELNKSPNAISRSGSGRVEPTATSARGEAATALLSPPMVGNESIFSISHESSGKMRPENSGPPSSQEKQLSNISFATVLVDSDDEEDIVPSSPPPAATSSGAFSMLSQNERDIL